MEALSRGVSAMRAIALLVLLVLAPAADAVGCAGLATFNQDGIATSGQIGLISLATVGGDTLSGLVRVATGGTGSTAYTEVFTYTSSLGGCDLYLGAANFNLFFAGSSWHLTTKAITSPCTQTIPQTTTPGWTARLTPLFDGARYSGTTGLDSTTRSWFDYSSATGAAITGSASTFTFTCTSLILSPPPLAPAAPLTPTSPPPPSLAVADPPILSTAGNIQHRFFRLLGAGYSATNVDLVDYGRFATLGNGLMFLRASIPSLPAIVPITLSTGVNLNANTNVGVKGNFSARGSLFVDTVASKPFGAVLIWVGMPVTVVQAPPSGTPSVVSARTLTLPTPSGTTNLFTFVPGIFGSGGISLTIGAPTATNRWGPLMVSLPGCANVILIAPPGMPHSPNAPFVLSGKTLYSFNVDNIEGVTVSVNGIPYAFPPATAMCRYGNGGLLSNDRGNLTFGTAATARYVFLDFAVVQSATASSVDAAAVASYFAATLGVASSPPPPFILSGLIPMPLASCQLNTGSDLRFVATTPANVVPFSGSMLFDTTQTTGPTIANSAFFSSPAGLPTPAQPFLPSPGTVAFGKLAPSTTGFAVRILVSSIPTQPSDFITLDINNLLINMNSSFISIISVASTSDSFFVVPIPLFLQGAAASVSSYITVVATTSTSPVQVYIGKNKITPTTYPATLSLISGGVFASSYAVSAANAIPAFLAYSGPSIFDIQYYQNRILGPLSINALAVGGVTPTVGCDT